MFLMFHSRHKKILAILFSLILLIGLGYLGYLYYQIHLYFDQGVEKPRTEIPPPPAGAIRVSGTMVCLPHRDTKGPHTLECAFGLRDSRGTYFALRDTDPLYKNISSVSMGDRVKVEGVFMPHSDSKYQDIGVIEITLLEKILPATVQTSGVRGSVLLGPTCPVIQNPPDPECADKPFETDLILATPDGARVIKPFRSNAQGKFLVEVEPGEYAIRSAALANILPSCSSENVTVAANTFTDTVIHCDTGIR